MKKLMLAACALAALLAAPARTTAAEDFTSRARAVFEKHKHAVVTVQLVIRSKVSMGGNDRSNEARQEVTGTVIDPSGLVVLSLSVTDPGQLVRGMLSEDNSQFKIETELSDVKILLRDGTEVPAELVLRDADLDLAFMRPKTKLAAPMQALDLKNAGEAEVLDEVLSINRLGRAAGRSYAASVERISAVMQRPRLIYVPMGGMTTTALGSPALTADGKVLGIFVVRSTRETGASQMTGGQPGNVTAAIIPAAQVEKVALQAPQATPAPGSSEQPTSEGSADSKDDTAK